MREQRGMGDKKRRPGLGKIARRVGVCAGQITMSRSNTEMTAEMTLMSQRGSTALKFSARSATGILLLLLLRSRSDISLILDEGGGERWRNP